MATALHFDFDGAWDSLASDAEAFPTLSLREWGPRLRFCAPEGHIAALRKKTVEVLAEAGCRDLPILYGSGDFHHLAGLWIERAFQRSGKRSSDPLTLLSFDNHPDWAVTPPRWACGGWINRALECPGVVEAAVWGCANMELNWPVRLLGNRKAVEAGRLHLFPWRERFPKLPAGAWPWLSREGWRGGWREGWRDRFDAFLEPRAGKRFYVTVDLDCLRGEDALTDWENGLFTLDDVAWALERVREEGRLAGGDLCGAASGGPAAYERPIQRFLSGLDHPALPERTEEARAAGRAANERAAGRLLPLLAATD